MHADEYLRQSARTAADGYHENLVSPPELDFMLQAVITAGTWADRVKRALFYGQTNRITRTWSTTSITHRPELKDLVHAMLGCVTESAEIAEHVRDILSSVKPADKVNLTEEFGDALWYIAMGLRFLDSDFGKAFSVNIDKLRKRFPDKFTEDLAINRDLDGERAVLEGRIEHVGLVVDYSLTIENPTVAALEAMINAGIPVSLQPDGSVQVGPEHSAKAENLLGLVAEGSVWRHTNGCIYTVLMITNEPNDDRYPRTIVYQGENGRVWSRRADDWHRSMTSVAPVAEGDPQS